MSRVRFKGKGANWAVARGTPQLRGLHKNSIKILHKETEKYFLKLIICNKK